MPGCICKSRRTLHGCILICSRPPSPQRSQMRIMPPAHVERLQRRMRTITTTAAAAIVVVQLLSNGVSHTSVNITCHISQASAVCLPIPQELLEVFYLPRTAHAC